MNIDEDRLHPYKADVSKYSKDLPHIHVVDILHEQEYCCIVDLEQYYIPEIIFNDKISIRGYWPWRRPSANITRIIVYVDGRIESDIKA
jgi:hypothetical protein